MAAGVEIRTHMMRIILGSQSKNRADILQEAGFEFDVLPPNIDEKAIRSSDPKKLPALLARAKTDALLPKISGEALLITSDQVVSFEGQIREKPETEAEARKFLETGHESANETYTAVEVTNTSTGKRASGLDIARVFFKKIPPAVINDFISSGEPFSHAGGFAAESPLLAPYIVGVEGEMDSILGLPMNLTRALIEEVTA